MRIMAQFPGALGVPSEVTNAITAPSAAAGGENPSATCLECAINSAGREPSVGSAAQGDEQQALELSYFPEVLVCEADSSVGGEGFVSRAAHSPKANPWLCTQGRETGNWK